MVLNQVRPNTATVKQVKLVRPALKQIRATYLLVQEAEAPHDENTDYGGAVPISNFPLAQMNGRAPSNLRALNAMLMSLIQPAQCI